MYTLAETLSNSVKHHIQNDFCYKKYLELMALSLTILSCSALNSAFVASVATFFCTSEFFIRLKKSDLSTNPFLSLHLWTHKFIVLRCVNIYYLDSMSDISGS